MWRRRLERSFFRIPKKLRSTAPHFAIKAAEFSPILEGLRYAARSKEDASVCPFPSRLQ